MDVAGRIGRLRELLAASACDGGATPGGLLVTKQQNIRYLTGFTGSAGMLLVLAGTGAPAGPHGRATSRAAGSGGAAGCVLFTDGRYRDQAAAELAANGVDAELEVDRLPRQIAALRQATTKVRTLALEAHAVTWALQRHLVEELNATLVPSGALVEQLRLVKDAGELARIEAACDIADVALAQVKEQIASRPSESELAAELEREMRRRGASKAAFETIVASGPNGARPHARPSERVIERGELVVIDFGAVVDGYHSDMTRTLCAGAPGDECASWSRRCSLPSAPACAPSRRA